MRLDVLDLIIVAIIALGGWNGYRTGLVRQITRLFGAVIAYFVSLWLRPYVADILRQMHVFPKPKPHMLGLFFGDLSDAVAFAIVFAITFILLRYAAGLIDALFSLPVLSTVNRLAGLIAGLALAVIFVYIVALLAHYINNPRLQLQLHNSTIIQWLNQEEKLLLPSFQQASGQQAEGDPMRISL